MTDTNVAPLAPVASERGASSAVAFAIKGGKDLSSLLGNIATAKEVERTGPVYMFKFLDEHYGDDELSQIPVVGSKKGETGNKPFDRYTQEVHTKDGKRSEPRSWYTDVIHNTDEYERCINRMHWCDDIAYTTDTGEGVPDDIASMGTGERATERKRLVQRIKDMRLALTKGAMLMHHVNDIMKLNPARIRVKMPLREQPVIDKKTKQQKVVDGVPQTEIVVTGNMIRLQDPAGEKEDVSLTVGEFNTLRPSKIPAGTVVDITALEKTKERAPKKKGKKGAATALEVPMPSNVENLLVLFNVISTALDSGTPQGLAMQSALTTACAKDGKSGDDVTYTTGTVAMALDGIWNTIRPRFDRINADRIAAQGKRATAQVVS